MPVFIPIKQIKLREYNRDEKDDVASLAESIREHGLLNPIIVTEIKKNQYHRRKLKEDSGTFLH